MTPLLRLTTVFSGLSGSSAIALSAYASHAPTSMLSAEARQHLMTSAQIQLVHAALIVALACCPYRRLQHLSPGFMAGLILFCTPVDLHAVGLIHHAYGAPVGGTVLILSWFCLAVSGMLKHATTTRRPAAQSMPE